MPAVKKKKRKKRVDGGSVARFRAFREPFLQALSELPYVRLACLKLNFPTRLAYRWRDRDKAFAKKWDRAINEGIDAAKGELYRRGVVGVKRPVVSAGKLVTEETVYSDQCLITLVRAHDPAFREHRVNSHVGKDGGPIQVVDFVKLIEEKERELIALGGDPVAVKRGLIASLTAATSGGSDQATPESQ